MVQVKLGLLHLIVISHDSPNFIGYLHVLGFFPEKQMILISYCVSQVRKLQVCEMKSLWANEMSSFACAEGWCCLRGEENLLCPTLNPGSICHPLVEKAESTSDTGLGGHCRLKWNYGGISSQ